MQVFDGNAKYQTQWNNLMRPCGLFVTRGKNPLAAIGEPDNIASTICVRGWTSDDLGRLGKARSAEVSPDQGIRIGSADERL